jgi:hypothetical protein
MPREATRTPLNLETMSTRDLLMFWALSLSELKDREVVRTLNNPIGDIAEALVAAHFDGERGGFTQKSWDVRTGTEKLQVKALRRAGQKARRNLSPVRSSDYDAVVVVIFATDLRVESGLYIPRAVVEELFDHNQHVNGRIIRLTQKLLDHPDVDAIEISDALLDR